MSSLLIHYFFLNPRRCSPHIYTALFAMNMGSFSAELKEDDVGDKVEKDSATERVVEVTATKEVVSEYNLGIRILDEEDKVI